MSQGSELALQLLADHMATHKALQQSHDRLAEELRDTRIQLQEAMAHVSALQLELENPVRKKRTADAIRQQRARDKRKTKGVTDRDGVTISSVTNHGPPSGEIEADGVTETVTRHAGITPIRLPNRDAVTVSSVTSHGSESDEYHSTGRENGKSSSEELLPSLSQPSEVTAQVSVTERDGVTQPAGPLLSFPKQKPIADDALMDTCETRRDWREWAIAVQLGQMPDEQQRQLTRILTAIGAFETLRDAAVESLAHWLEHTDNRPGLVRFVVKNANTYTWPVMAAALGKMRADRTALSSAALITALEGVKGSAAVQDALARASLAPRPELAAMSTDWRANMRPVAMNGTHAVASDV